MNSPLAADRVRLSFGPRLANLLRRRRPVNDLGVLLALAAMVGIIAARDHRFFSVNSFIDIGRQSAYIGIVAFGMVFLLAMREIDLSVGSTYALAIIGAAKCMSAGVPSWAAAGVGIAVGAGLGAVNGVLANTLRVPTIVVTLGTLSAFRGLVQVWTNSSPVSGIPSGGSFFDVAGGELLGLPFSVWVLVALCVVLAITLRRTRYGTMVRSIGSNERAAQFAGIPVARIRLYTLVLIGALAGAAGMLNLAYFGAADPTIGQGNELLVIAAAIIGGTPLLGGTGTVIGALLGALIIQVINSGLVRFDVPTNWSQVVTGGVIIAAVATDGLVRRRRQTRLTRAAARDQVGDAQPGEPQPSTASTGPANPAPASTSESTSPAVDGPPAPSRPLARPTGGVG